MLFKAFCKSSKRIAKSFFSSFPRMWESRKRGITPLVWILAFTGIPVFSVRHNPRGILQNEVDFLYRLDYNGIYSAFMMVILCS